MARFFTKSWDGRRWVEKPTPEWLAICERKKRTPVDGMQQRVTITSRTIITNTWLEAERIARSARRRGIHVWSMSHCNATDHMEA
jgi:hypothetical protein